MTRVIYKVGNKKFTSYEQAIKERIKTDNSIIKEYENIDLERTEPKGKRKELLETVGFVKPR